MSSHQQYMYRCLQLAGLGAGHVAPNPMVGAVLVHHDRIIGEGYHRQYGQAHAEVNCLNNVLENDRELIPFSTLYVSLEPCAHFGKTPPCADLIIDKKIPRVVVGCQDPFKNVDGKGFKKLRDTGIKVEVGVLENDCRKLNKRFFIFHTQHRPYIILKWAQTSNGKIAALTDERLLISNEYTNRLVHKWRGEEAAILIGTNTALADDPELTNRLWTGKNPVRLVIDMELRLPSTLRLFNNKSSTVIFNTVAHTMNDISAGGLYQITADVSIVHQVLHACYQNNIQSILIEGGAKLLQSIIDEDLWDEARIITNESMHQETGLPAPELLNAKLSHHENIFNDRINYYYNKSFSLQIPY